MNLFFIADVGSNWAIEGTPWMQKHTALEHIIAAKRAGASAVKFQLFTDEDLYGFPGPNRYSLPREWIPDLAAFAGECGIEFMCSAFSPEGYLFIDPFVNFHKVASAEMKDTRILDTVASFGKPVIVSTGGAHFEEVNWLIGYMTERMSIDRLALLECVACYPADPRDYNVQVLLDWSGRVGMVGLSDHTMQDKGGYAVVCAAAALGATVFECHLGVSGEHTPDYDVSTHEDGLADWVSHIRAAAGAMGDGTKRTRGTERDMTQKWRRRLKVIKPIKSGDPLVFGENFGSYRSLTEDAEAGPPERWEAFQNGTAKRDLAPGDPVWFTTVEVENGQASPPPEAGLDLELP